MSALKIRRDLRKYERQMLRRIKFRQQHSVCAVQRESDKKILTICFDRDAAIRWCDKNNVQERELIDFALEF